jgi:hypothetical protein
MNEAHPKNCSGRFGGTCTCGLVPRRRRDAPLDSAVAGTIKQQKEALGFVSGDFDTDVRAMLDALRYFNP